MKIIYSIVLLICYHTAHSQVLIHYIDERDELSVKDAVPDKATREFAVAEYYYFKGYYSQAYFWLNKAAETGYNTDAQMNEKCESNFLFYLKGICEKGTEDYNNAIVSFSQSLKITKRNFMKRDTKITKGENYFYEKNSYPFNFSYADTNIYYQQIQQYLDNFDNNKILDSIITRGNLKQYNSFYNINTFDAYCQRAFCRLKLNDNPEAIKDIQQYHSLTKDSTGLSCYIYASAANTLEKTKLAMTYYSDAIKDEKDLTLQEKIDCYIKRGFLYSQKGDMENACQDWNKAVSLGSEEAITYISKNCIK